MSIDLHPSRKTLQAWNQAPLEVLASISGVCLDIDDTLSTAGKLTAPAFSALWKLKEAGLFVIPITGRPAGWCDHIARFWPVNAVVGENGAFVFYMEKGVLKRIETPCEKSPALLKERLNELKKKIQIQFPQARFASDQVYREFDLAIDICEDVPPWTSDQVAELIRFCTQNGAHAKVSSIHVNTWFGDYDKRTGFENWIFKGCPGIETKKAIPFEKWLYIGDSPNDEPMFAAFPYSVGVANLKKYQAQLVSPPTWITPSESGQGFVEMTERLLQARSLKK